MIHIKLTRQKRLFWVLVVTSIAFGSGCTSEHGTSTQKADDQWAPIVSNPEFARGDGPLVLVDAAHGNFHTIDSGYSAFAELLTLDGYVVRGADSEVTAELLEPARVFVISNAVLGGHDAEWLLPTPSAFTSKEIEVIVQWVENGGSLFLIADHMPFPGATADLANAFGVIFLNGFAMQSAAGGGTLSFTRSAGSLTDHAITRGRSESEAIESVAAFTGQAFRVVATAQPLMHLPDDWIVLLPIEAWEFEENTPRVSARGLFQGATVRHGAGRVAVFGEAAMFTAQTWVSDGVVRQMGLNHASAPENAQFVLNVMHWLTGLIDD